MNLARLLEVLPRVRLVLRVGTVPGRLGERGVPGGEGRSVG